MLRGAALRTALQLTTGHGASFIVRSPVGRDDAEGRKSIGILGSPRGSSATTAPSTTTKGKRGGRGRRSAAERDAADAARTAKTVELHERIGEQVQALTADPTWQAMLQAAAQFRSYSLNNQL